MPRLSERGIALRNLKKRLQTRFLAAQVRRTNGIHDESEDDLDDMVYGGRITPILPTTTVSSTELMRV
jgi:hypothetical protein